MTRAWRRAISFLAVLGVTVGVSLTVGMGAASAAPSVTYHALKYDGDKSVHLLLYANGKYAGDVTWNADPDGVNPGDALYASDDAADGYGIIGWVNDVNWSSVREASTMGHASPYFSGWKTGNLPEGMYLHIRGCVGTSASFTCAGYEVDIWA